MELGDLEAVEKLKEYNIPELAAAVDEGWDIIAPIPSCVLMFKQELPLLFPGDEQVARVQKAFFDPFEYLILRHKVGLLSTEFRNSLGTSRGTPTRACSCGSAVNPEPKSQTLS